MTAFHPRDFRRGLRHAGLTHGEYRVAVELAEHSNRDDPIVWPSVAALADVCAMTERGVQCILSSLSAKGVAARVSSTKGGRGNTNRWRLLVKTPNNASGFTTGSQAETPNDASGFTANSQAKTPNETAQKPRTKLHKTPNRRSPEVVRSRKKEGDEGARARADEPTDEPLDVEAVPDQANAPPPEEPSRKSEAASNEMALWIRGPYGPRCRKHANHPNPPKCARCGDAREAEQAATAERERTERRILADAKRDCDMCDGTGQVDVDANTVARCPACSTPEARQRLIAESA